jgi:hypothetical protein
MIRHHHNKKILWRDDADFEATIANTVFNKYVTTGMPACIVIARTEDDIRETLHIAKEKKMQIGICSGGHSWSTNHLREGGLVLDMSHFNAYSIDKAKMTAIAEPGVAGHLLTYALGEQGLFFPSGHCKGVCLGGYLLKGGFGWFSQRYGLACESVIGLDIMTATGDVVHASESDNADLYWAARGAGSGFFGVVLRFHLRVFAKPKVTGVMMQIFTRKHFDDVMKWAHAAAANVPDNVEFQVACTKRPYSFGKPVVEVSTLVVAESQQEARTSLAFMRNSPIKRKAMLRTPFIPMSMRRLYGAFSMAFQDNRRWSVDNMWTDADPSAWLPALNQAVDNMPPTPSTVYWLHWKPSNDRPDMAFSLEDKSYIALTGSWKKPEDDAKYGTWATDCLRLLEPVATGIQLADENLHHRPAKFIADANMQRLDVLRKKWDEDDVFYAWHNRVN